MQALRTTATKYNLTFEPKQFGKEIADRFCPTFELYPATAEDLQGEFNRTMALADRGVDIDSNWARSYYTMAPRPERTKNKNAFLLPMAQVANGGPKVDPALDPDSPAGDDTKDAVEPNADDASGVDDSKEGAGELE
jgi:hypothetical protein